MSLPIILSSFLSGLFGAMGFGGGTVLIIYLAEVISLEQKQAQGINLLFFLLTGIFGAIGNCKNKLVDLNSLMKLIKTALLGMIAGLIIFPIVPSYLLKKLFGILLIFLGIRSFFKK